jgi:hypothetical protein
MTNVATKADLQQVETALRGDLRSMEQRLDLRFEQLDRRIDAMVIRLGGMIVIGTGVLIAVKYFG